LSVNKLALRHGIETLGFLTLTFAEHITCPKEAQRRLNSLLSNVIKKRYLEYIGVMERQKSGRIHYHLLIVTDHNLRKGFNFAEAERRIYRSANQALRGEWAFWRHTAPAYGFGRTEVMPVKSNEVCIARYVGKYISKHIENRDPRDKGARLVRYSRGARVGTTRFMFVSDGSASWRRKVALFAQIMGDSIGVDIKTLQDISSNFGKRWAYHWREFILNLPDCSEAEETAPSGAGEQAGVAPLTREGRALGKNTKSAATCDLDPSISNNFSHLRYSSLLVASPVVSVLSPEIMRELFGVDGTPQNTLKGVRGEQPPGLPSGERSFNGSASIPIEFDL